MRTYAARALLGGAQAVKWCMTRPSQLPRRADSSHSLSRTSTALSRRHERQLRRVVLPEPEGPCGV